MLSSPTSRVASASQTEVASRRAILAWGATSACALLLGPGTEATESNGSVPPERKRRGALQATELPRPGFATLVASAGAHQDVKPPQLSRGNWDYALFGSFGSGDFNPYYSPRGAYVLAASGGHGHPHFFGAAAFDFESMSWIYLPCANPGLDDASNDSIAASLTTKKPYWEMLASPQVPSAPHPYKNQVVLSPGNGGSAKGSMLYVARAAVDSTGGATSGAVHAFDLVTRTWSRASAEGSFGWGSEEQDIVYDAEANRYYQIVRSMHKASRLRWWDPVTSHWEQGPSYGGGLQDIGTSGMGVSAFLHQSGGVRALMLVRRGNLAGINLARQSAGWKRDILVQGEPIENAHDAWVYHPIQNVYYRRYKDKQKQRLHRLVPPTGNPLTEPWSCESVFLRGDQIPEYVSAPHVRTNGYKSLMYIPALRMLGWVTANGVALLNP